MSEAKGNSAAIARRHRAAGFLRRHYGITALALLLISVLALRLWWGWHIGRQLAALENEIRQRGEPVDPTELKIEPLPDSQNAWTLFTQAGNSSKRLSPSNSTLEYPSYPPFGTAWEQAATTSEQTDAGAFQLARQARVLGHGKVRSSFPSPLLSAPFISFSPVRGLANTLVDGALYRHLHDDDREAIERLRDMVFMARLLHEDDPLVSQLVALGINSMACNHALMIAPGLRFDSMGTRRAVRDLIGQFLDDQDARNGFRKAMVFERLYTTDYHRVLSAGTWVIRPLAERAMVRDMSESRTYAKAVLETNAAAASRVLAELPEKTLDTRHFTGLFGGRPPPSEIPRYSRWYESLDVTSHRYFHIYYQGLGERRAAAISLAVQLYRADHKKWPDRLDDLVPEYFAAVPADPFHEDGRPLGYVILKKGLPDGGDRPLVYFDEGTVIDGLVDSEPMYGLQQDPQHRSPRVEIRQYRDLSRWLPATRRFDEEPRQEVERQKKEELEPRQSVTQPSPGSLPEAVKNDPREANAPGNDAKKNNGRDD